MADSYYQGAYTGAEIDAAIGKVGGIEAGAEVNVQADWTQADNTKDDYIKNKPTLGTAAEKGVDSSPTASSTNLVESGGVATALAGKQATLTTAQQAAADSGITSAKVSTYDGYATSKLSAADVFGRGTQIPKDTDLDDFKAIGRYYSGDSTRTNSLVNKPFSSTGFDMEVRQSYQSQSSTDGIYQIAYTISGGVFTVKVRTYRYSGSPAAWAWTGWQTLAFTAAT